MDYQANTVAVQPTPGCSPPGVQVLCQCVGWVLDSDIVFTYGVLLGTVWYTRASHSQAVELLSSSVELTKGYANGY